MCITSRLGGVVELNTDVYDDTVVAATDGFSYYTVEFTYNDLQYVLDGDSAVELGPILLSLGLNGNASAVETSNTALFEAYVDNGIWYVRANTAFTSTEWMRVTIDGIDYLITVTDDVTADQSGSNAYIGFRVGNVNSASVGIGGFDVYGLNGSNQIQTTYHNAGYGTIMRIGSNSIDFTGFAYGKIYTLSGVEAYITAAISDPTDGRAVAITYTLTNTTASDVTGVQIGSYADTTIGSSGDYAPISVNGSGLTMSYGDNSFYLLPGDGNFTTRWFGNYSGAKSNVFNNTSSQEYRGDSGVAWSWTMDIPANSTVTRTAVLSAGSGITTYTLSFDSNGGIGTMNNVSVVSGIETTLPANTFTRTNYEFAGWAYSADATTADITDRGTITLDATTGNKTLYAVWEQSITPATCTPPVANDLTYTGTAQELVTAGSTNDGTLVYSLSETGTFSESIPSQTAVGDYTVYYKVIGDSAHSDSDVNSIQVSIRPATATITAVNASKLYGESDPTLTATVIGLVNGDATLDYTVTRAEGEDTGTYVITVTPGDNPNYTISVEDGEFTITSANPIVEAPVAIENLTFTGSAQELFRAGTTNGGTMQYSFDGETWTENILTATSDGTYTVYYRVVGNNNFDDVAPASITCAIRTIMTTVDVDGEMIYVVRAGQIFDALSVPTRFGYDFEGWYADEARTIIFDFNSPIGANGARIFSKWEPIVYSITEGENGSWSPETGGELVFRAVRNRLDESTFSHYTSVLVDGATLSEGDYTAQSGSVIIRLSPEYLVTLAPGEHTLEIVFDDASSVTTKFTIRGEAASMNEVLEDFIASTGENINYLHITIATVLFVVSIACAAISYKLRKEE